MSGSRVGEFRGWFCLSFYSVVLRMLTFPRGKYIGFGAGRSGSIDPARLHILRVAPIKPFDPSEIHPYLKMGKQCPSCGMFWGLNEIRCESICTEKLLST